MVLTDKEQTNTLLEVYNFIEKETPANTWQDTKTLAEGLSASMSSKTQNELAQAEPPSSWQLPVSKFYPGISRLLHSH
jgi:hypothetical protein